MTTYSPHLSRVFSALSDPTRLAVVERLAAGSATVSDLQSPFDMARQSFLKHLLVLEQTGVVASTKKGRVRTVSLQPQALNLIAEWLAWHRRQVEERLDRLGEFLHAEDQDDD